MRIRSALVTVTIISLILFAAVQIWDPDLATIGPQDVDFSRPPADVAAHSAAQYGHLDYAYRLDIAEDRNGPWKPVRKVAISHTDQRYWKSGPLGPRGVVIYGTDALTFLRPGESASWRISYSADAVYPAPSITQPFLVESIATSNASIMHENDSLLVIEIDSNPLKITSMYPGHATIYVDKRSGRIEEALVSYTTESNNNRFLRFHEIQDGPTAQPPADATIRSIEIFWDLLRGPLVSP